MHLVYNTPMQTPIGSEVFYLEASSKQIKTGTVVGMHVSESGYVLLSIISGDKKINVESAHVFENEGEAVKHKQIVEPIIISAEILAKKANDDVDALRKEVIGEPTVMHLADKIFRSK